MLSVYGFAAPFYATINDTILFNSYSLSFYDITFSIYAADNPTLSADSTAGAFITGAAALTESFEIILFIIITMHNY